MLGAAGERLGAAGERRGAAGERLPLPPSLRAHGEAAGQAMPAQGEALDLSGRLDATRQVAGSAFWSGLGVVQSTGKCPLFFLLFLPPHLQLLSGLFKACERAAETARVLAANNTLAERAADVTASLAKRIGGIAGAAASSNPIAGLRRQRASQPGAGGGAAASPPS
ncbi:hypothetical protein T492DRAFT_842679 [Pavlovales sp. CCMP2436]|nr:hypothetical protein T492DRAFT_842679 [Pavlovales sp. CCMP2436]